MGVAEKQHKLQKPLVFIDSPWLHGIEEKGLLWERVPLTAPHQEKDGVWGWGESSLGPPSVIKNKKVRKTWVHCKSCKNGVRDIENESIVGPWKLITFCLAQVLPDWVPMTNNREKVQNKEVPFASFQRRYGWGSAWHCCVPFCLTISGGQKLWDWELTAMRWRESCLNPWGCWEDSNRMLYNRFKAGHHVKHFYSGTVYFYLCKHNHFRTRGYHIASTFNPKQEYSSLESLTEGDVSMFIGSSF